MPSGSPAATSRYPDVKTNVTLSNNTLRGAFRAGLCIDRKSVDVTLTGNTIDGPADQGIWITSGVTGTGTFSGNTIQNLRSGRPATQNDSASTFTITG
ncbi:right-handed parallel beta-helix repeat-containing protein [Streptomyces sp. NPDC008092]|uniref:right-handed parallel beta-helix repeat-containing protein n=1 Tax=Streptomyces sp. NPDC008092 TaxID=3364808 RepID=UPI0036F1726D